MIRRLSVTAALLAIVNSGLAQTPSDIASGIVTRSIDQQQRQTSAVGDYWTPERMQAAKPVPIPGVVTKDEYSRSIWAADRQEADVPDALPILFPGWSPESGAPQPWTDEHEQLNFNVPGLAPEEAIMAAMPQDAYGVPQAFGSPPINPQSGPYGPFQRWSMQGRYDIWPRSIHGKLFFTRSGQSYVCSGTVVNRNVVATAGHCVSSGDGVFDDIDNILFCPGYNQAGPLAGTGCWAVRAITTSGKWHVKADFDYDYACLVTRTTGMQYAGAIGDRTGWAGVAFNLPSVQPMMQFGYPQGAPFAGTTIQQVAAVEWYEVDVQPGDQKSKYIGSDLTGGSSGGGWLVSWRHPSTEYPDTDASVLTDPIGASNGPYLNGVNSHSRCRTACVSPPTSVSGIFWQEMGSPVFRLSDSDVQDFGDVLTACFSMQ